MHAGEGIFVSNQAFLCRTGLFCVELCILLSNRAFLCRTSVIIDNKFVDHSDVVGALPVGAAPTTSSFSTQHLASLDWGKTTSIRDWKHLSLGIWCILYLRFYGSCDNLGDIEVWYCLSLSHRLAVCQFGFASMQNGTIGHVTLVAISVTKFCPIFEVKSMEPIWRSGTCRFHLWVSDLLMSCRDWSLTSKICEGLPKIHIYWSSPTANILAGLVKLYIDDQQV